MITLRSSKAQHVSRSTWYDLSNFDSLVNSALTDISLIEISIPSMVAFAIATNVFVLVFVS